MLLCQSCSRKDRGGTSHKCTAKSWGPFLATPCLQAIDVHHESHSGLRIFRVEAGQRCSISKRRFLIEGAHINQTAQAGHAADYQNKRLSVATHEVKEWMSSQKKLADGLVDEKPGYVGARMSKRMMTDFYARGVCRGAVECTNLTLHAQSTSSDPTRAESIKTAPVNEISLGHPLAILEKIHAEEPWPKEKCRQVTDARIYTDKKVVNLPPWTLYGGRGRSAQAPVWHLVFTVAVPFQQVKANINEGAKQ